MKYQDGQEVMIGDRVSVLGGSAGEVMFCIDRNEFSIDYPKAEWEYLGSGVMVKSNQYGLVHYSETDSELVLIARASAE